ncbi:MAG: nuclear transport factor 2 family protein, partial [Alphaproteobacteria bacterium]|nr:nuclear transport factor 2 family protein [Alphaproteobacteria bacterium]
MTPQDRMLAEHEIARLITRFALLNDAGDWAAVADTFTLDGRFIRPAGGDPVVGREAIMASFASRPPRKSCHMITNIVADLVSDTEATARCTMLLYTAPAGESVAATPALIGGFRDKLVRTAQGWR